MRCKSAWLVGLLAPAILAAPRADAQPLEGSAETEASGNDIVVTAQKRLERLQDVPASVAAFDGAELQASSILDLTELAPRVPGLFGGSVGTTRPQLYVRGVGTRQFDAGTESPVGIFVDEVFLGRTAGALTALRDVERVEILKGPQSTLYGRNTIAGAVNIVTRRPTDSLEVELEAGLGSYSAYNGFAAISGPLLGDKVKGRVAAWRTFAEGYQRNDSTGNHAQGTDNYGGRLSLLLEPLDRLTLGFTGEISRDDGFSFAGESLGNIMDPNAVFFARPGLAATRSPDRYSDSIDGDNLLDRDIEALTGRADYRLAAGTITSISAYRRSRAIDDRDTDNSNLRVLRQRSDERSGQFTQELRFTSAPASRASGKPVEWIVGAFYYHDDTGRLDTFDFGLDSVPGFARGAPQRDTVGADYETSSFAGFARVDWHLASKAELAVGGRYTIEKKRASFVGTTTAPGLPFVAAAYLQPVASQTYRSFDPSVTLTYTPNDRLNAYASYNRGFKGGGFQYIPFTAGQASVTFRPERLDAYEVGVKSSPLGGRVTANASLFYYDYQDLQVLRIVAVPGGGIANLIDNAASSRIYGGEATLSGRITPNFELGVDYAYTNAKYRQFRSSANADYSGTRMVRAPLHSVHVFAEQQLDLLRGLLTLRADASVLSKHFFEPGEGNPALGITLPLTEQPRFGVLDLRATYAIADVRISAVVMNATNTYYRRSTLAFPTQLIAYPAPPRTFGLSLGWSWRNDGGGVPRAREMD